MPRGSNPNPTPLSLRISAFVADCVGPRGAASFARAAGIDQHQLRRLLRGERTWYLSELEAVCDALQLDIVEVVERAMGRAADESGDPAIAINLPRPSSGEHDRVEEDLLEVADHSPDEDALRDERGEW